MAKIISVVSGKGGTGKSTLTALFSKCLAKDYKVLVVDLDVGMRSLDILFSLEDKVVFDLGDVLAGRCELKKALVPADGFAKLDLLSPPQEIERSFDLKRMLELIKEASLDYDYVFIDTPGGMGISVLASKTVSDLNVVVSGVDLISLRDARKMSDLLFSLDKPSCTKLVLNRVSKKSLLANGIDDLDKVIDFTALPLLGIVSEDPDMKAILSLNPSKEVKMQIDAISSRITGKYIPLVTSKI